MDGPLRTVAQDDLVDGTPMEPSVDHSVHVRSESPVRLMAFFAEKTDHL